jgi:hypothetical protein
MIKHDFSKKECSIATKFLHLLEEVLAKPQDASGGGGEDNDVLSGDITGGMVAGD